MPFAIGPKIHNVIPAPLKQLVEEFFSGADWRGLYLSGGTCLAEYYFGHRISVDMDLFTADAALFAQPFASVIITEYVPAPSPVAVAVVWLLFHK